MEGTSYPIDIDKLKAVNASVGLLKKGEVRNALIAVDVLLTDTAIIMGSDPKYRLPYESCELTKIDDDDAYVTLRYSSERHKIEVGVHRFIDSYLEAGLVYARSWVPAIVKNHETDL